MLIGVTKVYRKARAVVLRVGTMGLSKWGGSQELASTLRINVGRKIVWAENNFLFLYYFILVSQL